MNSAPALLYRLVPGLAGAPAIPSGWTVASDPCRRYKSVWIVRPAPDEPYGLQLADWRRARRLSQAALSDDLGIAASTVAMLESGERAPSADVVSRLARMGFSAPCRVARARRLARPGIRVRSVEDLPLAAWGGV